jgi:hypothetical protein
MNTFFITILISLISKAAYAAQIRTDAAQPAQQAIKSTSKVQMSPNNQNKYNFLESSSCSTAYCSSSETCCPASSTTYGCYSGSGDTCCGSSNYYLACPSSTPVCCTNGLCCQSGYTCSGTSCKKNSGCFAPFETVRMESGHVKPISDVVIGDRILAYSTKLGDFTYSPVVALLGRNQGGETDFMELWSSDGQSLTLTADHLIMSGMCGSAIQSFRLKQANAIVPGDCISAVNGEKRIVKTSSGISIKGAYSVVTKDDYIVVGDVVASPFSVNHAIPDFFYNIHRYLFHYYPVLLRSAATEHLTATMSYFADTTRYLLISYYK